ncbi:MAG: ATP phosphoribosyltransferase regulatory subunit [Gammaproteobacteria bacterium]|jgi:ATP phosphoribosyltransferase regulatory subunit|nr:ATP phosphoribosyltransferase regulatory subunit [Gammaproteobacteria bacterium]MBT4494010.1 ATP phosphoribosyltransferase regulatory subunit [Gammaproteobacteria bacterium]MBT7370247.1 ATP phosphoribosyltransferase regulatory subunit [Gammaproteobacteria bacterium]
MSIVDRWLLPDGVEDVLPPQARRLEEVRRRLLDLFSTWGYDYVIPPMVEYLESLLTGTGRDLDLKTLKVTDLLSGRTLGVRADITPQVARIDAHSLNREGVVRLCYAGTVVQSKADGMLESRTPVSVGAELFGDTSSRADIEIVSLMIESLESLGFDAIHLELGDVAIFRQLVESLDLDQNQQELLFAAVQRKAAREIISLCEDFDLDSKDTDLLAALPDLTGDESILMAAREKFKDRPGILTCIENLERVAAEIRERYGEASVYFDLSELRGYAYHTGIVFAAYVEGIRQVVAKGGRYDHIGQVFGRSGRGATGFSVNVRNIVDEAAIAFEHRPTVLVTVTDKRGLWQEIQRLREEGYTVVESGDATDSDFRLIYEDDRWQLVQGELK